MSKSFLNSIYKIVITVTVRVLFANRGGFINLYRDIDEIFAVSSFLLNELQPIVIDIYGIIDME